MAEIRVCSKCSYAIAAGGKKAPDGGACGNCGEKETMFQTGPQNEDQPIPLVCNAPNPNGERRPLKGEARTRLPRHCQITLCDPPVLALRARTFWSADHGLYCLRLQRVENRPELEYVQIIKRFYVGRGAKCAVRVAAPDFPSIAFAIDIVKGRYVLTAGVAAPAILLNGKAIPKGHKRPLEPPCRIEAGKYAWRFEEAAGEDFTDL